MMSSFFFFFFKQKTAYEIGVRLVGSEMCIRDRRRSRYHAVVIAMTGARGLEAAIQAKQLAPETPLVWWSDDKNFALIAYHLRIPVFLPADCSDQELYEAIKPIMKWRCENANCAMQL